ncbi:ELMO domain-containing protein 2 [Symbiodinium microadriaticum]|uniref:ELMO domain-containing protein 2 n=1 Tax=Symbiodinium microadriaticum TaxID=2951 RepID=A0A1Q9DLG0_SYMMI|nr:ELMO domain-containing protein 2 [Symbiodinium microadriaticum]
MEAERLMEEGRTSEQLHIEDQKSFCERCGLCVGPRSASTLTDHERDAVWHMRRRVVNSPKPEEAELHKQVLEIWNTAFPEEKAEAFAKGSHWKKLGFQGVDPATDVRTGAWPLEQLASFARHRPRELRDMVQQSANPASFYLFAISCFNISHMLAVFFDLNTALSVSPLGAVRRASKRQLRNLVRLVVRECNANNVDMSASICRLVLDEVFVEVLSVVHNHWLELSRNGEKITLMDFPRALRRGFDANSKFFDRPCDSLGDLKMA